MEKSSTAIRFAKRDDELEIRDTGTWKTQIVLQDEIEAVQDVGSLMPDGLTRNVVEPGQVLT